MYDSSTVAKAKLLYPLCIALTHLLMRVADTCFNLLTYCASYGIYMHTQTETYL